MKLINYLIIALIALIYCFESSLWASACELREPKTAIFDIQEGVIIENPHQQTPEDDDEFPYDGGYSLYPEQEDIG